MSTQEDFSVQAMRSSLLRGDVSSRELTMDVLERIERLEPRLHAFITLTPDLALRMADDADRQLKTWRAGAAESAGGPPPLLGVPIAVKDVLALD